MLKVPPVAFDVLKEIRDAAANAGGRFDLFDAEFCQNHPLFTIENVHAILDRLQALRRLMGSQPLETWKVIPYFVEDALIYAASQAALFGSDELDSAQTRHFNLSEVITLAQEYLRKRRS